MNISQERLHNSSQAPKGLKDGVCDEVGSRSAVLPTTTPTNPSVEKVLPMCVPEVLPMSVPNAVRGLAIGYSPNPDPHLTPDFCGPGSSVELGARPMDQRRFR